MSWLGKMFFSSMAGALVGLFWPLLVAAWKAEAARLQNVLGPEVPPNLPGMAGRGRRRRSLLERAAIWVLRFAVEPFVRIGLRALWIAFLGCLVAAIACAVGFAAFLHDEENQRKLVALGMLAYLSAFNYGFTASAIVGGAMKRD